MGAHEQQSRAAAPAGLDQAPAERGQRRMRERRQRGVQRQHLRQREVVLPPGQGLEPQTRTVEGRVWHDSL
jgi:hypothetical protein